MRDIFALKEIYKYLTNYFITIISTWELLINFFSKFEVQQH